MKENENITSFIELISRSINSKSSLNAVPAQTQKLNGIVNHGLTLYSEGNNIAPVIYLNEFYKRYQSGELTIDSIRDQILESYESLSKPNIPDLDRFMSSSQFIDNITIRLVNAEINMPMINNKGLIYHSIPGTDLLCLFYAVIHMDSCSFGGIALSTTLLEHYLPDYADADMLFAEVIRRIPKNTLMLKSITDVLKEAFSTSTEIPLSEQSDDYLYVLSNTNKLYGASAILTDAGREMICERFPDGKVTMLPSSIHEVLLLKTKENEDVNAFKTMVTEINRNEVPQADFLSDNVYHYDANTGILTIAE